MTNLEFKYKERAPLETIHIIKTFFNNKGYTTRIFNNIETESGSWHCAVELYKNNKLILTTFGKGVNDIYSQASGYAELFETFCNQWAFIKNPIIAEAQMLLSKQNNGYYFHPEEKELNIIEALNFPTLRSFYTNIFQGNMEYMAMFINLITSNHIIGQPYKNLANPNEIIYYDPRLNGRLCGSIGMAAGNTQEEALNQGLSEVCEHIAQNGFYSYPMDKYYRLDLAKLDNPELLKMINNIHKAGSEIYIYDLSYNFDMPVFMSIIINKNTKRSYVNFGSFPVADIAIERVITENYQGVQSFNLALNNQQSPYKELSTQHILSSSMDGNIRNINFIDENMILNKTIIIDKPNPQIYVDKNTSNKELNKYYINLFNKLNLSIHYIEHSPIKEMSAISIFIPEYEYINPRLDIFYEQDLQFNLTAIMRYYKLIHEILFNTSNETDIKRMVVSYHEFKDERFNSLLNGILMACDWLTPYGTQYSIVPNLYNFSGGSLKNTIFEEKYAAYYLLARYVANNNYDNEELITIFKDIYDYEITLEDIENCRNPEYRFKKCYIDVIRDFYFSEEHQEIIESFIKKPKI